MEDPQEMVQHLAGGTADHAGGDVNAGEDVRQTPGGDVAEQSPRGEVERLLSRARAAADSFARQRDAALAERDAARAITNLWQRVAQRYRRRWDELAADAARLRRSPLNEHEGPEPEDPQGESS